MIDGDPEVPVHSKGLSVIGYLLSVYVQCGSQTDMGVLNSCLAENLQETACGGSVLSTGPALDPEMDPTPFFVMRGTALLSGEAAAEVLFHC